MSRKGPPSALRRGAHAVVLAFLKLVSFLPARPVTALFALAGGWAARLGMLRSAVVRENLRVAFGDTVAPEEHRRIEIAAGKHLFMFVAETIFLMNRPLAWADASVLEIEGREIYERFVRRDRPHGLVSVSGHFGNWEVMGAVMGQLMDISVIAKELHDPLWEETTARMRGRAGIRIIHTDEGALKAAIRALRANGDVNMLFDQDMGVSGMFLPFFGKPASTTPTPAMLAIRLGVPIVPAFLVRLGPAHHRLVVHKPIMPTDYTGTTEERTRAIMSRLNAILEDMIRLYPAQYFWVHRRWKTTPEAAAKWQEKQARKRAARARGDEAPAEG